MKSKNVTTGLRRIEREADTGMLAKTEKVQFEFNFDKLTPAQLRIFGEISVNEDLGHNNRVLGILKGYGLIYSYEEWIGYPAYKVTRWEIPLHVHIVWCEWCAKNFDDEGNRKKKCTS